GDRGAGTGGPDHAQDRRVAKDRLRGSLAGGSVATAGVLMDDLDIASEHLTTLRLRHVDAEVGVVTKEGNVPRDGQSAGDRQGLTRCDLKAPVLQRVAGGSRIGRGR